MGNYVYLHEYIFIYACLYVYECMCVSMMFVSLSLFMLYVCT